MPIRLALEVISPGLWFSRVRPVAEALGMTVLKYRPGMMTADELRDAVKLMRQFTPEPWVILRSGSELPTYEEALADLRNEPVNLHATQRMEHGNLVVAHRLFYAFGSEPNHPDTACSPERYTQLLEDGLRLQAHLNSVGQDITVLPPGLMPQPWDKLAPWLLHPLRARYPIETYHIYHTEGMLGIMEWPHRQPNIVLEFGYSGYNPARKVALNLEVLDKLWGRTDAVIFFCAPSDNPDWTRFEMSVEDAQAYAAWAKSKEEEPMSETSRILEAELRLLQQECAVEGIQQPALDSIVSVWVLAGGDPLESLRRYLVGTRRLRATKARLERLSKAGKAAFQEINDAVGPYLPN